MNVSACARPRREGDDALLQSARSTIVGHGRCLVLVEIRQAEFWIDGAYRACGGIVVVAPGSAV